MAATVLLFLSGYATNAWHHYVSIGHRCHVGIWNRGLDSRIVFFNDAEYGPYRGSIIGLSDSDGNTYPPRKRKEWFGDSWGIYYRYFEWTETTLWTLMVTLWYPIVIFAILPAIRLLGSWPRREASNAA